MTDSVLVAMSGGVDSSVAAALLLEAGYDVTGVTLRLWGGESDQGCCSAADVDDARRVAQQLGIAHYVFNLADEFTAGVVEPYVAAHADGLTPNPCIECNRTIKFDQLLRRTDAMGFDLLATGHHARIGPGGQLRRGADPGKDQSYVLHMLSAAVLQRVRFPVGDMTKDEVRRRADGLGLRSADKPDSQEVCFIASTTSRGGFLADRGLTLTPGRVVEAGSGTEVGRVEGVELVTVGQRKGLGLAGGSEPRYVTSVDVNSATVTVGPRRDLLVDHVTVTSWSWVTGPMTGAVQVQTSAHGVPVDGWLEPTGVVRLAQPTRRVAPGQSVVAYRGDQVVGGGPAL